MQRQAVVLAALALVLGCGAEPGSSGAEGSSGQSAAGGSGGAGASSAAGGSSGGVLDASGIHAIDEWSSAELAPFDAMLGEARIVALGESVHTSGGYALAKARLIRHLVEARGFRVIALETPRSDARAVGDFVASCQGPIADAMKGIFWVFADEHLRSLLEWLCAWNQTHPDDPVSFIGFDVQQPWHDGPALTGFLEGLAVPGAKELAPAIAACDGVDAPSEDAYYAGGSFAEPIPADEYAACSEATGAIDDFFGKHAPAIESEVGARALALARLALLGVSAWEESKFWLSFDPVEAYQARDSAMATVLLESVRLDHPGARAVVWAHNFHVRQASQSSSSYPTGVICTGTKLREQLGQDYVAFGLLSSSTETNWPGVSCGRLPDPGPNDLESLLAGVGESALLVDLGDPELSLISPGASYGFGLNAGGDVAVPAEQFRGLIWLAESRAMSSVFGPTSCDP